MSGIISPLPNHFPHLITLCDHPKTWNTIMLLLVLAVVCFGQVTSLITTTRSLQSVRWGSTTRIRSSSVETTTYRPTSVKEGCLVEPNTSGRSEELQGALLADIERLSDYLGEVILRENPEVHDLYTRFRAHAKRREAAGHLAGVEGPGHDEEAFKKMIDCSTKISTDNALGVVRAFTQTLNLINAAEVHHRMRLLRDADVESGTFSPLPMREDSVAGTINLLLERAETDKSTRDIRKKDIFDALLKQKVDIVLTAHPTEVNRRTLLRKYRVISETLAVLDRKDLSPYEKARAEAELKREICSIWGSDEIRRQKPTPQIEARGGMAIVETVLWDAVPQYLRKLNAQCTDSLGKEYQLPLDITPIVFSSWMGGDRDGNPNVTPMVTYEVSLTQRLQAATMFLKDLNTLYSELAICKGFSPAMEALADEVLQSKDVREKYRRVIGFLQRRLSATIKWCENELENCAKKGTRSENLVAVTNPVIPKTPTITGCDIDGEPSEEEDVILPIFDSEELMRPLRVMHDSLVHGGFADVADGTLIDVIRRLAAFGLTLVPLDLRQESTRHMMTVDAITKYLGLGSYKDWDESTKINWLQQEIAGKRPLFRTRDIDMLGFDPLVIDTLKTVEVASKLGPGALGAYVISQATSASDVLAVMLLQKQFGMTAGNKNMMRVVPLFETLNDLTNAADVVELLFSLPGYLGLVRGKQEIMVGYSDSAKDAGRLAACWAQYESQEKMVKVAEKYGVELTFFHGKGGTVGRGGNPALYRAVLAHPPKTINGKFRVTEQGEMITQNFGAPGIAERTLDIYTAAVLAEKFVDHVDPKPVWRKRMDTLSEVSCNAYRTVITGESFVKYFRTATPELELGSLNIGSRPAKRNPKGGIESLRAIPWQFAWTQTRLHLPAWLGVGDGLDTKGDEKVEAELSEMYEEWPFFREMIDLIAMTLSKTDYSISKNYEDQLVNPSDTSLKEIGDELRARLIQTRASVLGVTGCGDLYSGFQLLKVSMKVRNPYVDPINVLQAEIMKRVRLIKASEEEGKKKITAADIETKVSLEDTLIVAVNGIAQGMKNSG